MKKRKENPLMGNQKRIKSINVGSDDENIIKKFVIILLVIILLVSIIYFVTEKTKTKEEIENTTTAEINYEIVSVGMLLNRPEKEYYVMVYDSTSDDAILYSTLINNYKNKKDHLKMYYCDLNNKLNSDYYNKNNDNKSNPKATKIDELNFGKLTLLKISNGKISKYLENYDEIKSLLNK